MRTEDLIHFCAPARRVMGCGTRAQLPALVQRLGWRCGVLVTDRFFTQNTPWVREYVEAARVRQIDVIAEQVPDNMLLKLSHCGHSPHRDQPALVLWAADTFVRRIAGQPAGQS